MVLDAETWLGKQKLGEPKGSICLYRNQKIKEISYFYMTPLNLQNTLDFCFILSSG